MLLCSQRSDQNFYEGIATAKDVEAALKCAEKLVNAIKESIAR